MADDVPVVTGRQALTRRYLVQQLDRDTGSLDDTAALSIGVQDTGPDGAPWALAVRGVPVEDIRSESLVTVWTLRGAPHVHRRADLPVVAGAVQPFSESDAAKRVFDASKPLREAGIPVLEALDVIAGLMRDLVREPMVKGEVSGRLAEVVPEPYLRDCRPCRARHLYEQPFRFAALRAGLELQPRTSPPVLQPMRGFRPVDEVPGEWDVVRLYLHLLGPATPKQVAAYLDAPVAEVKRRWPQEAVPVDVVPDHDGVAAEPDRRWVLADDLAALVGAEPFDAHRVRLVGPYDLYLQGRDRDVIAPASRHKELWPVLGRPGAVLAGERLVGTWRPRASGRRLTVAVSPWERLTAVVREGVQEPAVRLGELRGVPSVDVVVDGE
ncbi:winged helix DNA-binding domain-containing protein [Thalassiella azotivora]